MKAFISFTFNWTGDCYDRNYWYLDFQLIIKSVPMTIKTITAVQIIKTRNDSNTLMSTGMLRGIM